MKVTFARICRSLLVLNGVVLALSLGTSVAPAQGLTSQNDLSAVFDVGDVKIDEGAPIGPIQLPVPSVGITNPSSIGGTDSASETGPRELRSEADMAELLKAAKFDATRFDAMAYEFEIERDDWTIPVLLLVDLEDQRIDIVALLRSFKDSDADRLEKLERLLDENRELLDMRYGYSVERERIELWYSRAGISWSATQLQQMVGELGDQIVDDVALWSQSKNEATADESVASQEQPRPSTLDNVSQAEETLKGVWTATTKKGDTFALRVESNATFALAFAAKASQNSASTKPQVTTSTGKYRLVDNRLELLPKQGTPLELRVIALKSDRILVQLDDQQLEFSRVKS